MKQAHYDPGHWRKRGAEMRALADEANNPESKRMMLRLAEDYDELAKRAEERSTGRPDA